MARASRARPARLCLGRGERAGLGGVRLIFIAAGLPGAHWLLLWMVALLLAMVGVAGAVVGVIEGAFLRRLLRTPCNRPQFVSPSNSRG